MKPARLIAILVMVGVLGVVLAVPILMISAFSHSVGKISQDFDWDDEFNGEQVKAGTNTLSESFDSISQSGAINVIWKPAAKPSFVVSGPAESLVFVQYKIKGDTLMFGTEKGVKVKNFGPVNITVYGPQPESFSLSGTGDFQATDFKGGKFNLNIAGSGNVKLAGALDSTEISIAGHGDVDAKALKLGDAEISIAGSGNVVIDPSVNLDVSIAGSGDVTYFKNPEVSKSIVGSGTVKRAQ